MSGGLYRSALACCCTSLAVAAAAPPPDPVALELGLARTRSLYLVVDPDRARLSIRIRGVEVDAVQAQAVWVAACATDGGGLAAPELPAVWRVTAVPTDQWRRVIAPDRLEAYSDDVAGRDVPTPGPAVGRPPRFVVGTDCGWRLAVGGPVEELVPSGLGARIGRGWRRLAGRPDPPLPPTLVLETSPADARRVLHLFEPGTPILVARGAPPVTSWTDAGTPTGSSGGSTAGSPG